MNDQIKLKKVAVHNLKNVHLDLEKNALILFTGVSGSGKSSLAFDTIYVEGQRRYVESLSTFARRQMGDFLKPELESAEGISPTISIEQKTAGKNPRSTVGTLTEIYDYFRILYARLGVPHCPISGEPVVSQSKEKIVHAIQQLPENKKIMLLAPYAQGKKGEFREDFQDIIRKGFTKVRVDGTLFDLNEELILDGTVAHHVDIVIDRLVIKPETFSRIADSVLQTLELGKGMCRVVDGTSGEEQLFSIYAFSEKSGISYPPLEPQDFSFNSPSGMCPRCNGIGTTHDFNLSLIIDPNLSIAQDCCSIATSYTTVRCKNIYDNLADLYHFSVDTPWYKLSKTAKKVFLEGTEKKWTKMEFIHPITGARWTDHIQWRGVLHEARTRFSEAKSDSYKKKMESLMSIQTCPDCQGNRLKPYPAATLFKDKKIHTLTQMTIAECLAFFQNLSLSPQDLLIGEELIKEIQQRLQFLMEVGLHYLTLDRTAPTLSGGEAQRVRLASQIGCGLVGITYVLDEPSIGLHPRDNQKLIATLKHLRDMGNTVIVVEHDEETIWEADRIVDFGPEAGVNGGEILVNGSLDQLLQDKHSITGAYLSGRMEIEIPKKRKKKSKEKISIQKASHHNLKDLSVEIPLGLFVAVTGVSGSGKSSLISDILHPFLSKELQGGDQTIGAHQSIKGIEWIDKVISIDQSPIGRNPRSNPSTYIKIFDEIRDLFCKLPESIARGYKPGRFSFNVKEGSCTECQGMGQIKIDMDFMEDAWTNCPLCKTRRFDEETLSIHYKEKNIHDILEMDVEEACDFFTNIPSLKRKLETLKKVGMHYIKLGQSSTTLSGGEAQRIKLAKELVKPSTGKTFYILDEPTTGLHFHDVKHLLDVLHALVEKGNSVLVIEHHMDVVKTADWIIDLGPEGGSGGGELVGEGPPEKIAQMETPTGRALRHALNPQTKQRAKAAIEAAKKKKKKKEVVFSGTEEITVLHAEQNNLKNISLAIPRNKITVFTGPSGSGKSSLAFETIYAEGQRRYIESLSPYARQFVSEMPKPKVESITGLSPAIAIEQKGHAGNPRSTVGTMTEVYDYLRILYARLGIPHCPETGEIIRGISKEYVVERILSSPEGEKLHVLAPLELNKQEKFEDAFLRWQKQGYLKIRLNEEFYDISQEEDAGFIPYNKKKKNTLQLVIDRLKNDPSNKARLFQAIEQASSIGGGKLLILKNEEVLEFNLSFAVESTGKSYPEITPHTFAFNTPEGMCLDCMGLGYQYGANLLNQEDILLHSPLGLMRLLWGSSFDYRTFEYLEKCLNSQGIDAYAPLQLLSKDQLQFFMYGAKEEAFLEDAKKLRFRWIGINQVLAKAGKNAHNSIRQTIQPFLQEQICLSCEGSRLNPLAQNVRIEGRNLPAVCAMPIHEALAFIQTIQMNKEEKKLLEEVHAQIVSRLKFLCEVGLHYISLNRRAPTLSGGESQRIRLATQIGSGLTGVLYVLDEPSIGLHPHDNNQLNKALQKLKELGNTLLLVEHDPLTVQIADYIVDFGPESGAKGGYVTAKGTLEEILHHPDSLTGQYLSGRKKIEIPNKRRKATNGFLSIRKAHKNNLKMIDLDIPIGLLTTFTGVSGSGKSTLLEQIIVPAYLQAQGRDAVEIDGIEIFGLHHFDKMIFIDQNPIGQTARSDVGTYTDALTKIRDFFAVLPAAKTKGLQPKHFSFNHRKGMCTGCWGLGYRRVEMHFLPSVKVECEDCRGLRLNPVSLEVFYEGKNFGQYLKTTVEEAYAVFKNHPPIRRILETLMTVGLGYLQLGQETASLSGGEAQRLKLSRELAKRSTGKTLYLLDEPTTGLHSEDIQKLLHVLQKLVDKGNTMILIEHHVDMIKNSDYIIDLGPEAGEQGGYIVAQGAPEEIAIHPSSLTGKYL